MKNLSKTAILVVLVLFSALLVVGCSQRQEIGKVVLMENESYSIPGTSYSFVLRDIGFETNPATTIDIYKNGQFIKRNFLWVCPQRECGYCESNDRAFDDYIIYPCAVSPRSAEFLIIKNPG